MRTVAALTMIMAVVVAAIPVENLDIVRADNTTADLNYSDDIKNTSGDYGDKYDLNTYEGSPSSTPADQLNIQRIENNVLLNLFTAVKKNSDKAVIVNDDNMSRTLAELRIRQLDYYNYVELNGDFMTVFNDTFKDIRFALEFNDTDSYQANGGTSTPADGSPAIQFDSFSLSKINADASQGTLEKGSLSSNSGTLTAASGSGLSLQNARDYIGYDLSKIDSSDKVQDVFTTCAPDTYAAKQTEISDYNSKIDGYIKTLTEIQTKISNNTATENDKNNWDDIKNKMDTNGSTKAEYDSAKKLELSFGQFSERAENGLTLLTDYMIRNTIYNNKASGETLAGCELVNVGLPSGGNAYIPKLKDGESTAGNQKNDNDRYLVGGRVEIEGIKSNAFEGNTIVENLTIDDEISYIGKNAFAGCSSLENVVFSQNQTAEWYGQDNYWAEALTIDENAFKTGSQYLIFHGAIHPDYAPFKLAMSENNESMLNTKSRICYKTDAPLNLIVIRSHEFTRSDNTKVPEKVTLIDYPHYEEIDTVNKALKDAMQEQYNQDNQVNTSDYSITDKFEAVNGVRETTVDYSSYETMWDAEAEVIQQALNLYLPRGIESIDAREYYNNSENANDLKYLTLDYTRKANTDINGNTTVEYERDEKRDRNLNPYGSGDQDVKSLYSSYEGINTDEVKTVPGLISGYFNETSQKTEPTENNPIDDTIKGLIWRQYNDHYYTEHNQRGNDYLTRVTMPAIERIPDYGFDSNENLKEITIGNALNEVGVQPFRDCKSLWWIDTADSTKYEFENMILYDKSPADGNGGYKIVQGLEGRGRSDVKDGDYGSSVITADTNPLLTQVTDIAKYAFADNKNVYEIDLSKSNVRNIMEGTFNDCNNLRTVVLPERTRNISDFAFGGVDESFRLTIPNKDCQISQKAFMLDEKDTSGVGHVTIKGIKFEDEATNDTSVTYDSFLDLQKTYGDKKIEWSELGKSYTLRFYDDTWKLIASEIVDVKDGETSASLSQPPADPVKTGYKFDTWVCPKVLDKDGNPLTGAATYTDVTEDRDIYATFKEDPTSVVPDGNDYTLTVENGKALVNGTIISTFPATLKGGTTVTVIANNETNFKVWTITPGTYTALITSPSIFTTTFTMPNANVVVTANTAIGGGTDTPNPDGTYTVTVNNGTGSGQYKPGATVTITANKPNAGASFVNWTTATAGVSFAGATSSSTTFVMPSSNVTVTANFSDGSGGQPGGNTPGGDSGKKYKVTVNYGSGSGEYEAGATVNITANAPDSSSRVFSRWTTNNSGLGFANANSVSTSFVMPAADVTVTANYKTRTNDDDDDDDDGPSRRPGTNTTTNTVTNRPGSSTSTTGTNGTVSNPASGTGSDNGNRIYITKNGISNTDVASLAVSGSTDNFIVRITESPEATAAVEQALTNTYGSLNGLAYLPMDISLYDSTGQNKITDTTGLNITVTMPIPDVLIQYGGNARVAAADNGNLQQITPRFTTIDGIACVSFVPPHFSPYVIYVDTNNLIAGNMLDSTPATGDPIHPKWFAAIGMACVSILLFVLSDGRKRRKYRAA